MNTVKNYAAQAIAAIRKQVDDGFFKYVDDGEFADDTNEDGWIRDILTANFEKTVHFSLPDDGVLLNTGLKGLAGTPARLPFPHISLNFDVHDGDERLRFMVIAEEQAEQRSSHYIGYNDTCPPGYDATNIRVSVIVSKDGKHWVLCKETFDFHSTWDCPDGWYGQDRLAGEHDLGVGCAKIYGWPMGFFPTHPDIYALDKPEKDAALAVQRQHLMKGVAAVLELCEALTCSNVKAETVQQASPAVNAKRIKKGKLPLYETKVLTIEVPRTSHATGAQRFDRQGPRQHLRRGHIRTLADNRRIWVNACVVGDPGKGKLDKRYRVVHG